MANVRVGKGKTKKKILVKMEPLKGLQPFVKDFKEEDMGKAHKEFLVKRV